MRGGKESEGLTEDVEVEGKPSKADVLPGSLPLYLQFLSRLLRRDEALANILWVSPHVLILQLTLLCL